MAQTIKQRDYLFRARPRRTRPALAAVLLGMTSLIAAGVGDGTAEETASEAQVPVLYGAIDDPDHLHYAER